jgi:hypothetical protein
MTPNSIEFIDTGRWVMRITADRRIEVNEGVDVSEAAQKVLDAMQGLLTPQRTWVGLTNNELQPIADEYRILFGSWVEDFARAIEAKLKEKNNG